MHSAARIVEQNDVDGNDFLALTSADFRMNFKLTEFLAEKIVRVRDEYLERK